MSQWSRVDLGVDSSGRRIVMNQRGRDMHREALEQSGVHAPIVQGGYQSRGASASAGTHAGGTVLDYDCRGLSSQQVTSLTYWLRRVGFAAWYRPNMPPRHIHAVAMGDRDLVRSARNQVTQYKAGRNGLANRGPDTGPSAPVQTWEQYQTTQKPDIDPREWDEMASKKEVQDAVREVTREEVHRMLTWPTKVDGFTGRISLHQALARLHNFARSNYMKLH